LGIDSRDEAQVGLFVLGVPDPTDVGGGPLVVGAVRRLETSPFSPDPQQIGLELDLGQGLKEITDLEHLSLARDADGTPTGSVMGGRHRAVFHPDSAAALMGLLNSR